MFSSRYLEVALQSTLSPVSIDRGLKVFFAMGVLGVHTLEAKQEGIRTGPFSVPIAGRGLKTLP